MRRIFKWLGVLLAAIVLVALVVVGLAWRISEKGLARVYASNDPPLTLLRDPQTLAQGAHLFVTHERLGPGAATGHRPRRGAGLHRGVFRPLPGRA